MGGWREGFFCLFVFCGCFILFTYFRFPFMGNYLFFMFVFPLDLLHYSINIYTYFFTSLMYMLQLYCGYNFVF